MRHACVANAHRHALMGDDTARGIKRATACRQLAWCNVTRRVMPPVAPMARHQSRQRSARAAGGMTARRKLQGPSTRRACDVRRHAHVRLSAGARWAARLQIELWLRIEPTFHAPNCTQPERLRAMSLSGKHRRAPARGSTCTAVQSADHTSRPVVLRVRTARSAPQWPGDACTGHARIAAARSLLSRPSAFLCDQFGQLHGVERGALADVVGDDPQVQATRVREVFADATDEHRILAGGVRDRRRVAAGSALVHHFHARRCRQQRARRFHGDLVAGFDRHRFGVAIEHRHAHRGGVHLDAVVAEDLAGFPDQLHLFLGVAVVLEVVDVRNQVKGDLHREPLRVDVLEAQQLAGLLAQFFHRRAPAAGDRLVGRHIDALDAVGAVDRAQCHQHLHGRAIGVGDDAARALLERFRIDLGNHQRHVVVVAERRRIIDHHRTGRGELGAVFLGHASARGEQRDVHAGGVELGQILHIDLAAIELHLPAGRARRRQRVQGGDREVALGQDAQHGLADSAGGAHDRDVETTVFVAHEFVFIERGNEEALRAGFGEPPMLAAEVPYRLVEMVPVTPAFFASAPVPPRLAAATAAALSALGGWPA
ncbi:hypothetical protein XFF6991_280070 [Xanthomonas phaseoli pv. phaseoli]|uniref:Uncharacterized protein n=1 Tax=Xanthomonas campestris pv. phaseoli TaxID=317013 RepID=A0A7Z7IZ98_XANCH|nr:hypothetical protein XFF6991_280070 [Xanthomonas phaseoli pv. phaseoli]